jgi:hypothetical protein
VSDDSFFSPNRKPPLPRVARPGEPLWEFRQDHIAWSCELRYHGEFGVEAQILRNGELLHARTFRLRATAVRWANDEREDLEKGAET